MEARKREKKRANWWWIVVVIVVAVVVVVHATDTQGNCLVPATELDWVTE